MKFDAFVRTPDTAAEAFAQAEAWKSAAPATRKAALKRMGGEWEVRIGNSITYLRFCKDGTTRMTNRRLQSTKNRYEEPAWLKNAPKYQIDPNRKVIGFAYGRPIYA